MLDDVIGRARLILYLHGFRSSPASIKSRLLAARCAAQGHGAEFLCPQLPVAPQEAARLIEQLAASLDGDDLTIIGSSLGGYYATWLAERVPCRVVLLNPAVKPQRDLTNYLGRQSVYHSSDTLFFKPEYIGQLERLWVPTITRPDRYLLVAAKGDELLDWREMVQRYPDAQQLILEGSDHGISDFPLYIDRVLAFCANRG